MHPAAVAMEFPDDSERAGQHQDRLSDLPDGVVGHILSFLPADEAARAAVLSRRWRNSFASVHTLSFQQEEVSTNALTASDYDREYEQNYQRYRNADFVGLVDAAIDCRRRCGGGGGSGCDPGLRSFRVVFDSYHHSLAGAVDRWLSVALRGDTVGIHVDARRHGKRQCRREQPGARWGKTTPAEVVDGSEDGEDDDDSGEFRDPRRSRDRAYRVPRALFSARCAATVRTLCLGSCFLDQPAPETAAAGLHFPSVETLALHRIPDCAKDIQRLVSACPRLADLTLDSCRRARAITVRGVRLRRLALLCCHGARLTVDGSDLRELQYKGPVPDDESVLSFAGSPPTRIVSCDIEFCGEMASSDMEFCGKMVSSDTQFVNLARFLSQFADYARQLRLASSCLGCCVDNDKTNSFLPQFRCLRKLELKGAVESNSIAAVWRILEQTPHLEMLSLLIMPDERDWSWCPGRDVHEVPTIRCLRERVKEVNVVHYRGRVEERLLLKSLLRVALELEELYVVFSRGEYAVQARLMAEIESWVVNRRVKVMFA